MRFRLIAIGALSACLAVRLVGDGRTAASTQAWTEDLAFLESHVSAQHPNAFHDFAAPSFHQRLADLTQRLGEISDDELTAELARIMAAFGPHDGHTRLDVSDPMLHLHVLPLWFYEFSDGLFVRSAATEWADLVGGRVVAIGDTPIDAAWSRVLEAAPGDNPMSKRANAARLLLIPEMLHGLGIVRSSESVPITIRRADGTARTAVVRRLTTLDGVQWVDARQLNGGGPLPLYLQYGPPAPIRSMPQRFHSYEWLEAPRTLFVQFNVVDNAPDETVDEFFRKVFTFTDTHDVQRFVLDLRHNGGGNNFLNRPILLGLIKRDETINKRGRLFVITGRETFSAAQNLVTLLGRYTNAIFVGEPTGGSPNHYGDARPITLPHSGIHINVSTLWWQDSLPTDHRESVVPELRADLSSSDFAEGRDPALEAILQYDPAPK
jgi:hypothetical protein